MAAKEISVKKYVVRLSGEERERLEALIRKGKSPAQRLLKARILLKADVSEAGEGWSDSRIIRALGTGVSMIYRVRKQLVEEGFEAVLSRKQRATPAVARIFDGEKEAKLIALACCVASQYASALGKNANCQTLVSLTLARGEVPVMVTLRLFLPDSWTSDRVRLERAGVPAEHRVAQTKPEMALVEVDRIVAAGVRFGCVLADAGYGLSAPFRHGLTARGLAWAVGIPRHLKVYPVDVKLIWPAAARGRPRQRHVPDILSKAAEDMLADAKWRTVSWRTGTKGKLKARFAAVRVRTADGPPQRIRDKGQQHLPGDEAWLIGEHRASGEKKYYLANLPAATGLRTLAATIKARWICEQAHQQLKEELGLDHFEGRSWQGLHRHALMTMIAFAFLQHRRLKKVRREKTNQRTTTSTKLASRAPRHRRTYRSTSASAMPALPKVDLRENAA